MSMLQYREWHRPLARHPKQSKTKYDSSGCTDCPGHAVRQQLSWHSIAFPITEEQQELGTSILNVRNASRPSQRECKYAGEHDSGISLCHCVGRL